MVHESLCYHHDAVYTYNWRTKYSKQKDPGQEEASAQKQQQQERRTMKTELVHG